MSLPSVNDLKCAFGKSDRLHLMSTALPIKLNEVRDNFQHLVALKYFLGELRYKIYTECLKVWVKCIPHVQSFERMK